MCASFLFKKGVYYPNFGSAVKSKPIEPVLYSYVKKTRIYKEKKERRREENENRNGAQNGNESVCLCFFCFFFLFFLSPCAGFCSAQLSLFLTKHSKLNHIEHLMSAFGSMQIINSE